MSETILVALIAGGAALLGSAIGLLTNVVTSKWSAKQHLWAERHIIYAKLIECYTAYIAILFATPLESDGLPEEKERDAYTQFQSAYCSAILICENSTSDSLTAFLDQVVLLGCNRVSPPGLSSAYKAAVTAMRKELIPTLHKKIGAHFHK